MKSSKTEIDKAVQYIKKNYAKNVTVAELAAHFCKMFKKKTGCSPREYKERG